MLCRLTATLVPALLTAALLTATAPSARAAAPGDPNRDVRLAELLDAVYPEGVEAAPTAGRELFLAVLGDAEQFEHRAVGPFDLYLYKIDGQAKERTAQKTADKLADGLAPLVPFMDRHFGEADGTGLMSGRRFPIVVAESLRDQGQQGFDRLVALLDRCEDLGFSDWKPVNEVWSNGQRAAEVVRTWEVQLFNLGDEVIADREKEWFAHGIGYYTIAHMTNRMLRRGAWGTAPPWLAQGLIDELDIEAYGEAWVGSDTWERQVPGWHRQGWSGFVPKGSSPPPAVTGPPADLAVTIRNTGDSWAHRSNSPTRHWEDLATDRKSEAPASFAFMARNESFLPRDRAYARCVLHLMLAVAPHEQGPSLVSLLDDEVSTPHHGMPDSEPLTVLFAEALGGVPAVDELETEGLEDMLAIIGRSDIADRIRALGAKDMLRVADHRAQAQWLYGTSKFDLATRGELFNLILEAEYYQQLHQWELIGQALDRGAGAVLASAKRYPKRDKDRQKISTTFWSALADDPSADG